MKFVVCAGYQAEDGEMVTTSSDAEALLLYPAGVDVTVSAATSSAAGPDSDSDTATQLCDDGVLPLSNTAHSELV